MSEKRMLIVDAELVKKVDGNRGDMGQSEFINFLIETQLKEKEEGKKQGDVTREEFHQFQEGTKELLLNFLQKQSLLDSHKLLQAEGNKAAAHLPQLFFSPLTQ